MLQDQIVEKVHNGRIQERLLLEADLTLDKATQIANQLESAMANASEFVKPAELSVQRLHMRKKEANTRKGTQLKQQSRMRVQPERRCYVAIQAVTPSSALLYISHANHAAKFDILQKYAVQHGNKR